MKAAGVESGKPSWGDTILAEHVDGGKTIGKHIFGGSATEDGLSLISSDTVINNVNNYVTGGGTLTSEVVSYFVNNSKLSAEDINNQVVTTTVKNELSETGTLSGETALAVSEQTGVDVNKVYEISDTVTEELKSTNSLPGYQQSPQEYHENLVVKLHDEGTRSVNDLHRMRNTIGNPYMKNAIDKFMPIFLLDKLTGPEYAAYEQGIFDPFLDKTSSIYDATKLPKFLLQANDPEEYAKLYETTETTIPDTAVEESSETVETPEATLTPIQAPEMTAPITVGPTQPESPIEQPIDTGYDPYAYLKNLEKQKEEGTISDADNALLESIYGAFEAQSQVPQTITETLEDGTVVTKEMTYGPDGNPTGYEIVSSKGPDVVVDQGPGPVTSPEVTIPQGPTQPDTVADSIAEIVGTDTDTTTDTDTDTETDTDTDTETETETETETDTTVDTTVDTTTTPDEEKEEKEEEEEEELLQTLRRIVEIAPGPLAEVDPAYDFETIFANPEQAEFFAKARQEGLGEYLDQPLDLESLSQEYTAPVTEDTLLSTQAINPYDEYDFSGQKASDNDILQKLIGIIKGTT
jgi:PAS domain-containing protein